MMETTKFISKLLTFIQKTYSLNKIPDNRKPIEEKYEKLNIHLNNCLNLSILDLYLYDKILLPLDVPNVIVYDLFANILDKLIENDEKLIKTDHNITEYSNFDIFVFINGESDKVSLTSVSNLSNDSLTFYYQNKTIFFQENVVKYKYLWSFFGDNSFILLKKNKYQWF